MRKLLFAVACFGLLVLPVMAQNVPPQHLIVTNTDGALESGWVVGFPTGSSDYFNSRHDGLSGRPIAGVAVGSADFGSGTSYPQAGLYDANFGVDASGNTPDLTSGFNAGLVAGGGIVFNYVYGPFFATQTPTAEPQHVIAQLPPGDSGLLGIGNDDTSTTLFAGWTLDGYTTPANGGYNFGLNAIVNAITELQTLAGSPPTGRGAYWSSLHEYLNGGDETGDFTTMTVGAGGFYGVSYQSELSGVKWQVWLSFLGAPIKKLSPTLFTFTSGGGSFLRAGDVWPGGFGGLTFNFVGIGGKIGVIGTVHTSDEITLVTKPDVGWGTKDDGSYEAGYVVSIPTGSSDYFNNNYNIGVAPTTVQDIKVAVMDFGTFATSYPTSGVFESNYGVDGSGFTPDLTQGHAVAPFTFVAGTFATSSGLMTVNDFADFPYATFPTNDVHGVIQFPPGDSGFLGVGTDTNSTITSGSAWTLNGYTTPANKFGAKWGIRVKAF